MKLGTTNRRQEPVNTVDMIRPAAGNCQQNPKTGALWREFHKLLTSDAAGKPLTACLTSFAEAGDGERNKGTV